MRELNQINLHIYNPDELPQLISQTLAELFYPKFLPGQQHKKYISSTTGKLTLKKQSNNVYKVDGCESFNEILKGN